MPLAVPTQVPSAYRQDGHSSRQAAPTASPALREHAHRSHCAAITWRAPARAVWTARHAAAPKPSSSQRSCQAAGSPAGSGAASNQHPGAHIHHCSYKCKPRVLLAHKAGGLLAPLRASASCPRPSPGPGKKGPFSLHSSLCSQLDAALFLLCSQDQHHSQGCYTATSHPGTATHQWWAKCSSHLVCNEPLGCK